MDNEMNTPPGHVDHGGVVFPGYVPDDDGDPNVVHPLWMLSQSVTPDRYEDVMSAWAYARHAHSGQTDKVGRDYFDAHVTHVTLRAAMLAPTVVRDDAIIAALLHDVVEDTTEDPADEQRALAEIEQRWGVSIRADVDGLTQRKTGRWFTGVGERWPELERRNAYLRRCCARPVSAVVKFADHLVNSDPAGLLEIPNEEVRERLREKYGPEGKRLRRALREHFGAVPGMHRGPARENEMGDRR